MNGKAPFFEQNLPSDTLFLKARSVTDLAASDSNMVWGKSRGREILLTCDLAALHRASCRN